MCIYVYIYACVYIYVYTCACANIIQQCQAFYSPFCTPRLSAEKCNEKLRSFPVMRTQCFVCFFCQSDAESSWNKNVHPSWCIIYLDHNSTSYFPYDSSLLKFRQKPDSCNKPQFYMAHSEGEHHVDLKAILCSSPLHQIAGYVYTRLCIIYV